MVLLVQDFNTCLRAQPSTGGRLFSTTCTHIMTYGHIEEEEQFTGILSNAHKLCNPAETVQEIE